MIINDDLRGRSRTGKFARRYSIEWSPDDFPPDSQYWKKSAESECLCLRNKLGPTVYREFAETLWPGETIDVYTFREIAEIISNCVLWYNLGYTDPARLVDNARNTKWYHQPTEPNGCHCVLPEQSCSACRDIAAHIYDEFD